MLQTMIYSDTFYVKLNTKTVKSFDSENLGYRTPDEENY